MENRGRVLTRFTALKADLAAAFAEKSRPYLIIKRICTTTVPGLEEELIDNLLIVLLQQTLEKILSRGIPVVFWAVTPNRVIISFSKAVATRGNGLSGSWISSRYATCTIVAEGSYFWKRLLAAGDALRSDADL